MGFRNFTNGSDINNTPVPPAGSGISNANPLANTASAIKNQNAMPSELIDYNQQFKNAAPISFRDEIIDETYAILMAAKKPNALLIGPAGVGKTAIAQEIARRLANNDPSIPDSLKNMHVCELPITNLIAGAAYVGDLEKRLKNVIDYTTDVKNHVILFIDEIHLLMSHDPNYTKIAQLLKPALARGNLRVIGATTTQESRDLLCDPAFNRRFSRIIVEELTQKQELTILKQALPNLIKHYHNQAILTDDLLPQVVQVSDKVLRPKTHRPDSGLTLLDRSLAEAIVKRKKQIKQMQNNSAILQMLKKQTAQVNLNSLNKTAKRIISGVSQKPNITKAELIKQAKDLVGQDKAKSKIINAVLLNQLDLFNTNKPFSFLLSGPSGVGKTMIAKIIAKCVTNTKPITINMTEYNSSASINRLIGSPAGYVGSDSHREMPFDSLESNPYQVILLDEFEKANPAVQRLFMRVLDEGILQLANNHEIDFSKTIIFATTNASHHNYSMNPIGFTGENNNQDIDKLNDEFDTELLNRFSRIIDFNSLTKDNFKAILQQKYQKLYPQLNQKLLNLNPQLSKSELDQMTQDYYNPAFGARPCEKALEDYIQSKI